MEITIEKLVSGGMGMGRVDGKVIFVPFAAVGDVLDVELVNTRADFFEGRILRILTPSPDRVTPRCSVFGECGGCQWQHLSYERQLFWKRQIVCDALLRIGKINVERIESLVANVLPSPKEWHYRNRIHLQIDSKGRVGFHRPESRSVVEFDHCWIADEQLNAELNQMRELWSHTRKRTLDLRLEGKSQAFAQVNTEQNEVIKQILSQWMPGIPHAFIVELYAGSGNFTFEMARFATHIMACDVDGRAIRLGKAEAQKRGLTHIEFSRADAKSAAQRIKHPVDCVVLDPPRKGALDAVVPILSLSPQAILYISCDPATFARDVAHFEEGGMVLQRVQPVDMFPQTFHVEVVSLLTARGSST